MNDDTELPDDDRDLWLARRMGTLLDANEPPEAALDPSRADEAALARAVAALRGQAEAPSPGHATRLWHQIEAQTTDRSTARPARMRLVRPAWIYATAAVVALAAVSWLLLRPAAPVLVASAGDDRATYTAPDGSVVTLRAHSALYALDGAAGEQRYRLTGEAFFDVARDPSRTFVVEANEGVVTVLGTRFNVSTWGAETAVYLEEGSVRFAHPASERAVVLAPGQRSVLSAGGALLAPAAAPAADYTDWLRSELSFTERPLRLLLAELSQHYGVAFDVPPALLDETLTGTLPLDAAGRSVADLGAALGGTFVEDSSGTYRFAPGP